MSLTLASGRSLELQDIPGDPTAPAILQAALAAEAAEDQLQVGLLQDLSKEQPLEPLAGVLDGALQGGRQMLVLGRQGQIDFQLGAQVDTAVLALDLLQTQGRLGLRGGAHGENLLAEDTCHAHLLISPAFSLPPRPQTCDR